MTENENDFCWAVWERQVEPDRIVWGRCKKAPGHSGQHGSPRSDEIDRKSEGPES